MDEPLIQVLVREPIDCPFSCPDSAFLHQDDCVITRLSRLQDGIDRVVLRVLGSPFIRPLALHEAADLEPETGRWVFVEYNERYGVPWAYYDRPQVA